MKQTTRRYAESICDASESTNRGVSRAAFQIAQITSLETCSKCQLLLGQADLGPDRPHVFPKLGDNVHRHSRKKQRDMRCPLNVSFSTFQVICHSVGESAVVSEGLEQVRAGRNGALSELHRRYAAWFRARLIRRYGVQDAEDLFQETWLRVAPYQAEQDIRHPKALLLRIASNLAADHYANRNRRIRHAHEAGRLDGWGFEMPAQTDEVLAKQLVLGLPVPLRDVFVLSRFGGLTNSQIGEQLGISPKTVEWRMTKALAHCAAQLRR